MFVLSFTKLVMVFDTFLLSIDKKDEFLGHKVSKCFLSHGYHENKFDYFSVMATST